MDDLNILEKIDEIRESGMSKKEIRKAVKEVNTVGGVSKSEKDIYKGVKEAKKQYRTEHKKKYKADKVKASF